MFLLLGLCRVPTRYPTAKRWEFLAAVVTATTAATGKWCVDHIISYSLVNAFLFCSTPCQFSLYHHSSLIAVVFFTPVCVCVYWVVFSESISIQEENEVVKKFKKTFNMVVKWLFGSMYERVMSYPIVSFLFEWEDDDEDDDEDGLTFSRRLQITLHIRLCTWSHCSQKCMPCQKR